MSTIEFETLVMSSVKELKPFAAKFTDDRDEAQDLLQETLCRAFASKSHFTKNVNIIAWLYTIMRNIFINNYNKRKKHYPVLIEQAKRISAVRAHESSTKTAESLMSIKEIDKLVHDLPLLFKRPFMLYLEGFKYMEIAEITKEPIGTIKSRIHFAKRMLQDSIDRF